MKIFGTGLQRTGTMSLTAALNDLHISARQFPKELYPDINHPLINEYDAFTDFPIPLLYKELDKAHPGSKFIHTIRDEKSWLNSVQWLFTTGSVKFNTVENIHAQTFHQEFYGTTHFDEQLFLARYRRHNEEVAAYFADRPGDLLIINLAEGNNYEKICAFLGQPVPDKPFPYTNKSEGLARVRFRKIRRQAVKNIRNKFRQSRLRPFFIMSKGAVSPLPLTSPPERLSCQPFFILTAGRSGSTLLRAILDTHPDVCIPPESHRLGQIVQNFQQNYRFLPWSYLPALVMAEFQKERGFAFWKLDLAPFFKMAADLPSKDHNLAKLIDTFYNYYIRVHKPAAVRWGDKTVRNARFLPQINALFPNARYIHIIRDGRDVAVSLNEQGHYPNPSAAAQHWLHMVSNILDFSGQLDKNRYLEVFYEELVENPAQTIQKVCKFLGLEYSPEMLNFWQRVDELGDAGRDLHRNLKNPLNTSAIGKWKQHLNPEQKSLVEERLATMLAQFGYI